MVQKTNSFERFWNELKRRKVVHVITVYAAIAFGILQLVDIIGPSLKWPDWTMTFIIVLLCIGFIISVFVSWIYDITPAGVKKTKPASAVKHTDQTTQAASSGWKIATYVSGLIIVVLVAFNFFNRRNLYADISKLEKSIAVLPFTNDSPDSTNQYFCNGMMEEILTQLQKIGGLKVKSRTSGERYRHPDKDIRDIGRELRVSFIVEGSVRKVNDDLRITAQLINAKTGDHLWADTYNGKYTDKIFEFQNNLAIKVASSLNAVLTQDEKKLIEKKSTASIPAYDLYLKANNFVKEYEKTRDSSFYQNAVTFYKTALMIDPSFAKAYTGLARAYYDRYYYPNYFKEGFLDSCLVLADQALSIDDQLDEAYYMKGLYYEATADPEKALVNFDRASKINPNHPLAYYHRGIILLFNTGDYIKVLEICNKPLNLISGNERPDALQVLGSAYLDIGFPDKAKYYYQEALTLDGDSASYFDNLSGIEYHLENFEEALTWVEKAIKIDSTYRTDYLIELSIEGRYQEAYKVAEKYIEQLKKSDVLPLSYSHRIGYAFYKVGKYKEANYYFNEQIKYGTEAIKLNRYIPSYKGAHYDLAGVYAFIGDKVKAYQYLNEFNTMSFYPLWWVSLAKHDPLFDSIRNEDRFQKILQNMEAKYQAEHERVRKWLEETGQL